MRARKDDDVSGLTPVELAWRALQKNPRRWREWCEQTRAEWASERASDLAGVKAKL